MQGTSKIPWYCHCAGPKVLLVIIVIILFDFFFINSRSKENGFHERPPASLEPPAKRICTISPAPRHSPAHPLQLPAQIHPTPPPLQHYALDDISTPHLCREPHRILELRELKERPRLTGNNTRQHAFNIHFHTLVHFSCFCWCFQAVTEATARNLWTTDWWTESGLKNGDIWIM